MRHWCSGCPSVSSWPLHLSELTANFCKPSHRVSREDEGVSWSCHEGDFIGKVIRGSLIGVAMLRRASTEASLARVVYISFLDHTATTVRRVSSTSS
jgi:hypothetical protein